MGHLLLNGNPVSGRVQKAYEMAERAHGGQKRRHTGEPYINHCISVASTVDKVIGTIFLPGGREDITAASILHDTIEDTTLTYQDIFDELGANVTEMVYFLTDDISLSMGKRSTRKHLYRKKLVAAPMGVRIIKMADILDNAQSLKKYEPQFYEKVFKPEISKVVEGMKRSNRDATNTQMRDMFTMLVNAVEVIL